MCSAPVRQKCLAVGSGPQGAGARVSTTVLMHASGIDISTAVAPAAPPAPGSAAWVSCQMSTAAKRVRYCLLPDLSCPFYGRALLPFYVLQADQSPCG